MIDTYELYARAEAMPNLMGFFLWPIGIAIVCGIVVYLQMQLARAQCKWRGLILPAVTFLVSLVVVGRTIIFSAPVTMQVADLYEVMSENAAGLAGLAVVLFVITNIPTVILLFIYRSERKKMNPL